MPNPSAAAAAMRSACEYVRQHLHEVVLSDAQRAMVLALCSRWQALSFDLIDDGLSAELAATWTREVIESQHQVVKALEAAAGADSRAASACVLVSESAANVLNAYGGADPRTS